MGLTAHPVFAAAASGGADVLRKALDQLEVAAQAAPHDRFEPAAIVQRVGVDPQKLFSWVRTETQFVPYSGALRGPQGVLMDRVGSDLDRSLLLAQLLVSSGKTVRLAHLTLSDEQAEARLNQLILRPALTALPAAPKSDIASLLTRAHEQAANLLAILPKASTESNWDHRQLAGARDHRWVQLATGDQWRDFDLDFETKKETTATHLGNGDAETLECPVDGIGANVPDDSCHQITFRVVVERWSEGKLTEENALEWKTRAMDFVSGHLLLVHQLDKAATADLADAKSKNERAAALLAQKTWRPIFIIAGKAQGSKAFDETGTLTIPGTSAQKVGQAIAQGFGGFGGFGGGDVTPVESVLTAEYLDFVLHVPGEDDQVVRRTVFDSLSAITRSSAVAGDDVAKPTYDERKRFARAAALSGWSEQLITVAKCPPEFYADENTRRLLADKAALVRAAENPSVPENQQLLRRHALKNSLEFFDYARSFETAGQTLTYLDRPNVARLIVQDSTSEKKESIRVAYSDFAFNPIAVLAPSPSVRFASALNRGIADTMAESLVVGAGLAAEDAPVKSPENTAVIFALAKAKKISPVVVQSPTDLDDLKLGADVKQLIAADLQSQQWVVLPMAAVAGNRRGWWKIDPTRGTTIGVMDNGLRSDTAEYAEVESGGSGDTLAADRTLPPGSEPPPNPYYDGGWLSRAEKLAADKGIPRLSEEWFNVLDRVFSAVNGNVADW